MGDLHPYSSAPLLPCSVFVFSPALMSLFVVGHAWSLCLKTMHSSLFFFFFQQKCGRSRQASAPVGPLRQLTSQLAWQTSCGLVSQIGQQAVESITSSVCVYGKPLQCLCYTRYRTLITEEREGQQPLRLVGASENTLFSLLKALSFYLSLQKNNIFSLITASVKLQFMNNNIVPRLCCQALKWKI